MSKKCIFILDMSKYKKPIINEELLGRNPFTLSLQVLVNKVQSDNKFKVHDKNSGEDAIFELANFEYEADNYCKVFTDSKRRIEMSGLSMRGKDLYLWLIYETDRNKDWLWLNKVRYMEECKVNSINTYKKALKELIKQCFLLATCETDTYWINPHYFFSGNRLTKFPDNIKVKASSQYITKPTI